jgi:hypothetical protein
MPNETPKTSSSEPPVAHGGLATVQAGRGVIRCFIDAAELRRLCARMAAAELAGAAVRAALQWSAPGAAARRAA